MSGRDKPAYDPARSPMWEQGRIDGDADRQLLGMDPPRDPQGPTPPFPAYRKMYDLGYEAGFQGERKPR